MLEGEQRVARADGSNEQAWLLPLLVEGSHPWRCHSWGRGETVARLPRC